MWINTRGGVGSATAAIDGNGVVHWETSVIPLQPGENPVIVSARDYQGHFTLGMIIVTYTP